MHKLWIVSGSEILGYTDSDDPVLPDGFTLIEGPDLPRDRVYLSNGEILEKPPQPDPRAVWDGEQWVMPVPPAPPPRNDWEAFYQGINGTDIEVAIATKSNPLAFFKLGIELGASRKTGIFDIPYLVECWNACAATAGLAAAQIEMLNLLAEEAELSVRFNETTAAAELI